VNQLFFLHSHDVVTTPPKTTYGEILLIRLSLPNLSMENILPMRPRQGQNQQSAPQHHRLVNYATSAHIYGFMNHVDGFFSFSKYYQKHKKIIVF
jgi:hypothetical protein